MKVIDVLEFIEREEGIAVYAPIDAGVGELFGVKVLRTSGKENVSPEFLEWLKALDLEVWKISADINGIRIDCKPKKFEEEAQESRQEEPGADPEETDKGTGPEETDKSTDPEETVVDEDKEKTKMRGAQKPISPLYSRICTVCGKEFKAKSGAAKSCPECRASGRKKGDKEVKELTAELFDAE